MRSDGTAPTRGVRWRRGLLAGALLLVPTGCTTAVGERGTERSPEAATTPKTTPPTSPTSPSRSSDTSPSQSPGQSASRSPGQAGFSAPSGDASPATEGPRPSDGRPAPAELVVPALGLRGLPVVPYRGWTDDAPGTRIQDAGRAASPHGPRGGVGPGGVGNYQVTAHRLSSTAAFRELPSLRRGDEVVVVARGRRWTYRIVATRETSFRSEQSLREQRAAVPGQPGVEPTRAMITLSTCATIEDHAAGNYWSDEFGNPEHRIDKIGRLVEVRPAA